MEKVYVLYMVNENSNYLDYPGKDTVGIFATIEAINRHIQSNPLRGVYCYYDWEEFEVQK